MSHHLHEEATPRWTLTTSIPYVNAQPHIGHALEMVQADTLARYHRLLGHAVRFQSGTDENALKNVQAAEQAGIPTQTLVESNAARFAALQPTLNLAWDDFIRTSAEARHRDGVAQFWRACVAKGDIYQKRYQGLYCVGCELFYSAEELIDGCCPIHERPPELVEEENYFFRLSRYAPQLLNLLETNQLQIVPETRKNEMLSFIRRGLADFSISRQAARSRGWGIPVPDDPTQVIYVWFDALVNYITGPGYATASPTYGRFWQAADQRIHLIGKDITRFHAIYWPAMLLSAGVPLPDTILVHGFITIDGGKVSKSKGNVIDPVTLVEQWGTDALRYYLLRKVPTTGDANFTLLDFAQTYNADLADQLGNLLNRVVNMLQRYYGGIIPAPGALTAVDQQLIAIAEGLAPELQQAMAEFSFTRALTAIWTLIAAANKYIVQVEPWALAKRAKADPNAAERLATTLFLMAESLRLIANALIPFLPQTAMALAQQVGIPLATQGGGAESATAWCAALTWGQLPPGTQVQPGSVLFVKQMT
ncbi:MAG: class I tRNA ligase family protein [Caldilineaceae bacterium]|nr:class I tRNA ligase family protein [Caldilineaceae bacterium]